MAIFYRVVRCLFEHFLKNARQFEMYPQSAKTHVENSYARYLKTCEVMHSKHCVAIF